MAEIPYTYEKWVHEFQHVIYSSLVPDDQTFFNLADWAKEAKKKFNGLPADDIKVNEFNNFLDKMKDTGFYTESDIEVLKHGLVQPGMTNLGVNELLSVHKEVTSVTLSPSSKGVIKLNRTVKDQKFAEDSYTYVTRNIFQGLEDLIHRGVPLNPDQKIMYDRIKKTGDWNNCDAFKCIYLDQGFDLEKGGEQGFRDFLNRNPYLSASSSNIAGEKIVAFDVFSSASSPSSASLSASQASRPQSSATTSTKFSNPSSSNIPTIPSPNAKKESPSITNLNDLPNTKKSVIEDEGMAPFVPASPAQIMAMKYLLKNGNKLYKNPVTESRLIETSEGIYTLLSNGNIYFTSKEDKKETKKL